MKEAIAKIIFITPAALIFLSFLMTLIEDNGVRLFQRSWYRYGIRIHKTTIDISNLVILPGEKKVIRKEEGCFCFDDDGKIYFRSNPPEFRWFRYHTPFSFKATASINDINHLIVIARLPIWPTILSFSWSLLGLLLVPLSIAGGIGFSCFPWLLFLLSYSVEKGRMETMVSELKEILVSVNK